MNEAKPVKFETLSSQHVEQLFQFELENRSWFESLIASRGDNFYTLTGVKKHILDCTANAKLGIDYSGVLIENEVIVARANLKSIDGENGVCSVGYRVAKNSVGKGYASYCLAKLIKIASNNGSLCKLEAQVLDNNPASATVLKKLGFKVKSYQPNFMALNGKNYGCTTFESISK